jgi:diguanylate cyclase (GGDEF)-like protein
MNHVPLYLNTAIGACLIIALIFLDYVRKFNTDVYQRRLFLIVLGASFGAAAADFIARVLEGMPGITSTLYAVNSLFYVSQIIAYYFTFAFIDYFAHANIGRTKKIVRIIAVFLCLWCVSVVLNIKYHFYFYISGDNMYTPGKGYLIRFIINYLTIFLCLIDMIFSSKAIQRAQVYLVVFFGFLTGAGAALDVIVDTGSLTWPCFAAALLYMYFFIVRSDLKIDSLTGIGNRYSFNEFIDRLARQGGKKISSAQEDSGNLRRSYGIRESWAIVMIDMDHFKEINDTLGHLEGDNALRDMAAIIKSCIRRSDFAARYGGDEFVLATRAENDIRRLMDRIKDAIAAQNEKKIRPYTLEISYGYDVFTTGGEQSIDDFLVHVDGLMYKHKAERRRASDRTANIELKP